MRPNLGQINTTPHKSTLFKHSFPSNGGLIERELPPSVLVSVFQHLHGCSLLLYLRFAGFQGSFQGHLLRYGDENEVVKYHKPHLYNKLYLDYGKNLINLKGFRIDFDHVVHIVFV